MSTTYSTVLPGDTFATIARRVYGDDKAASRIARANPGVAEPLQAGTIVSTPLQAQVPVAAPSDGQDEISLSINGRRFRYWESLRITRAIDQVDTVELVAPFEPSSKIFRDTFRPFSFSQIGITIGGEQFFAGTLVGVTPRSDPDRRTVAASGYSLPGVLGDCTAPASAFSVLETDGQNLREIATTLADLFAIDVQFDADPGPVFDRVALRPTEYVWGFLAELARQRGLVVSSTHDGKLLFRKSLNAGVPVARLSDGNGPLLSVLPAFSPQQYYSHVTGIEPVMIGTHGSQFTVKNTRLLGGMRPHTFTAGDVNGGDLKAAVEAKASRMFANTVSYTVRIGTWRDQNGALWEPNTIISLDSPSAMIYGKHRFIVRSVSMQRDNDSATATLDLVLPGAFSGELPEILPWEG